jgi:hypothetical protein
MISVRGHRAQAISGTPAGFAFDDETVEPSRAAIVSPAARWRAVRRRAGSGQEQPAVIVDAGSGGVMSARGRDAGLAQHRHEPDQRGPIAAGSSLAIDRTARCRGPRISRHPRSRIGRSRADGADPRRPTAAGRCYGRRPSPWRSARTLHQQREPGGTNGSPKKRDERATAARDCRARSAVPRNRRPGPTDDERVRCATATLRAFASASRSAVPAGRSPGSAVSSTPGATAEAEAEPPSSARR